VNLIKKHESIVLVRQNSNKKKSKHLIYKFTNMRTEMKEVFEKLEAKRKLKPTDDRKIDAHELAYMLFYCHMFYEAIERVQQ